MSLESMLRNFPVGILFAVALALVVVDIVRKDHQWQQAKDWVVMVASLVALFAVVRQIMGKRPATFQTILSILVFGWLAMLTWQSLQTQGSLDKTKSKTQLFLLLIVSVPVVLRMFKVRVPDAVVGVSSPRK